MTVLGSVLLLMVMSPHNLASIASKEFSFIQTIDKMNNCLPAVRGWGIVQGRLNDDTIVDSKIYKCK